MEIKEKNPAYQAGQKSKPALILTTESLPSTASKRKKPFMRWWEDTLDNHWPLDNPPDWDGLSLDQQRIYKLSNLGYALRKMEGRK